MKHGRAERGRISGDEVRARWLSRRRRKLRFQRQLEEFNTASVSSTCLRAEPQRALEGEAERHLNLSRTPNRLVHDPQTAESGTCIEAQVGLAKIAAIRSLRRRTGRWEIVEEQVLRDVVDRNVEARSICEVEDLEAEFEGGSLGQLRELHQRDVGPLLPGLAKDVALAGGEVGFVRVAGRNRAS
jgi:hypothetical protein